MSNSKLILYGLECDHAAPGAATLVNGVLFCAWCENTQTIVRVIEYEWKAKCHNCTYARWTGLSRTNAGVYLANHIRNNPSHEGHMEYTRNPEAIKTAAKMAAWKGKAAS